jgi:hypothetical protein
MSFSDVEMPGSSNSDSEPDIPGQVCVVPDVAAAYKRGPEKVRFCQTEGLEQPFALSAEMNSKVQLGWPQVANKDEHAYIDIFFLFN